MPSRAHAFRRLLLLGAGGSLAAVVVSSLVVAVVASTWTAAARTAPPRGAVAPVASPGVSVDGTSTVVSGDDLRVHVRLPSSLRPGAARQVRVQVLGSGAGASGGRTPLLEVSLSVTGGLADRGTVWVSPARMLVDPHELSWRRIRLSLAHGVACGSDLGELRVEARELVDGGRSASVEVQLPKVDCDPAPPGIEDREVREAVTVCGDGLVPRSSDPHGGCRPPAPRSSAGSVTGSQDAEEAEDAGEAEEAEEEASAPREEDPDGEDRGSGEDGTTEEVGTGGEDGSTGEGAALSDEDTDGDRAESGSESD